MRKLRANVDIYVDLADDISEEEALEMVDELIRKTNQDQMYSGWGPVMSEIETYEFYEAND